MQFDPRFILVRHTGPWAVVTRERAGDGFAWNAWGPFQSLDQAIDLATETQRRGRPSYALMHAEVLADPVLRMGYPTEGRHHADYWCEWSPRRRVHLLGRGADWQVALWHTRPRRNQARRRAIRAIRAATSRA